MGGGTGPSDQRALQARHEQANSLRQLGRQADAAPIYKDVGAGYAANLGAGDAVRRPARRRRPPLCRPQAGGLGRPPGAA
jgi:hypothetical protein